MEQTLGPIPGPRLGYTKLSVFVIYSLFILKKSLCYPPDERRSTLQTKFGSTVVKSNETQPLAGVVW